MPADAEDALGVELWRGVRNNDGASAKDFIIQRHGVNQQVVGKHVRRVEGMNEKGAVRRAAKESGRDGAAAALSGGRWGLGSGCRR